MISPEYRQALQKLPNVQSSLILPEAAAITDNLQVVSTAPQLC